VFRERPSASKSVPRSEPLGKRGVIGWAALNRIVGEYCDCTSRETWVQLRSSRHSFSRHQVHKRNSVASVQGEGNSKNQGVSQGVTGDREFGSNLGPDSAEYPLKPHYKTQNQAKRFNKLDNQNYFGTRERDFVVLSFQSVTGFVRSNLGPIVGHEFARSRSVDLSILFWKRNKQEKSIDDRVAVTAKSAFLKSLSQ
jgi:hypothetical protein